MGHPEQRQICRLSPHSSRYHLLTLRPPSSTQKTHKALAQTKTHLDGGDPNDPSLPTPSAQLPSDPTKRREHRIMPPNRTSAIGPPNLDSDFPKVVIAQTKQDHPT